MRKRVSILVVSMALLLVAAVTVAAAPLGPGGAVKIHQRFAGRQGAWVGKRPGLELTPEQQEKILQIKQQLEKETLELRHQLQQLHFELRRLWGAEHPDQTAIQQKLSEMVPLRIELRKKNQQARAALENILTPEQLEKLKSSQPAFPRPGRKVPLQPLQKEKKDIE